MAHVESGVSTRTRITGLIGFLFVASTLGGPLASSVLADPPDHLELLITRDHYASIYGVPAGFCWNKDTNDFYTCIFGSGMGLRRYDVDLDVSYDYAIDYDLLLFHLAEDLPNGISDPDKVWGTPRTMAMSLNPAPLTYQMPDPNDPGDPNKTITLNYGPGELAFIINYCPDVLNLGWPAPEWTKTIFRWDLRELFSYTDEQPDYDNATDSGYLWGAFNQVDYNDAFWPVCTHQDFYDACGHTGFGKRPYVGHFFTWSSDGKSIYISHWGRDYGGIYKVQVETGDVGWIYESAPDPCDKGIYTEVAMVPSSVRDFGQGSGDQVIYGHYDPQNPGGLSFIVDDGNSVTGSHPLVTAEAMWQFLELGKTYIDPNDPNQFDPNDPNDVWDPNGTQEQARVMAAAADANGVVYFYEAESYGMYMYDQLGRLVCLNNKAQQNAFNRSQEGLSEWIGGGMLHLQPRDANHPETGETITQVMYRSNNSWAVGLNVYRPGDFDRDGAVDANDTSFFVDQYRLTRDALVDPNELPAYTDGEIYIDYIKADLNGSAQPVKQGEPLYGLENVAVTIKDLEVLLQFVNLWQGDLDWDGDVDATDQSTLNGNLGMAHPTVFDGDLDCDGDVDADDQALLAANLGTTYSIDPGVGVRGGGYPEVTLSLSVKNDHMGEVTVTPPPRDPNTWTYPWLTEVTLRAAAVEGKSFKQWEIVDPNFTADPNDPPDPNYTLVTPFNPVQIRLCTDRQVTAAFACGSGIGPMLPAMTLVIGVFGFVSWRRHRR